MKKIGVITAVFMIWASVSVLAQTETPRATTRQKAQRARIHEGRKDGEVTNAEAYALNKEQKHIRRTKRRAKADGVVTGTEKAKIERKQDRASRHVRRAKHNDVEKQD